LKNIGVRMLVFLTGCFVYSLLEIASRGFTHWTMTLTGGFLLYSMKCMYGLPVRLCGRNA